MLIGLLVVSGLALVAADRHMASTTGWLASLVASASLLLAVPSVRAALLAAVLLAPVAGLLVHAVALRTARTVAGPAGHRRDGGRADLTATTLAP